MGDSLVDELLAHVFCSGLTWRDLPRLALVCRYAPPPTLPSRRPTQISRASFVLVVFGVDFFLCFWSACAGTPGDWDFAFVSCSFMVAGTPHTGSCLPACLPA
jgi:hypothetical protein